MVVNIVWLVSSTWCSFNGITNCFVRRGDGGRKDLGVTAVYKLGTSIPVLPSVGWLGVNLGRLGVKLNVITH